MTGPSRCESPHAVITNQSSHTKEELKIKNSHCNSSPLVTDKTRPGRSRGAISPSSGIYNREWLKRGEITGSKFCQVTVKLWDRADSHRRVLWGIFIRIQKKKFTCVNMEQHVLTLHCSAGGLLTILNGPPAVGWLLSVPIPHLLLHLLPCCMQTKTVCSD